MRFESLRAAKRRTAGSSCGRATAGASELPHGDLTIINDSEVILRFDGLLQPWIKEAAKRWARNRMLAASSPSTMRSYLRDVRCSAAGWPRRRPR